MSSKSKLIINCGATCVTAGYFNLSQGQLVLEKFFSEDLNYDYSNSEEWLGALTEAIKRMNLSGKATVIAPAFALLPKSISVPHVSGSRQEEVIRFEAEKNMPYELSDVTWDYQVISDDGVETEILLVSMKASLADEFCAAVSAAGVIPELLEASSILDYNAWKLAGLEEDSIILNVGARMSNMIIARNDGLFVRSIPIGGNAVTQGIADALGKTFLQAEPIKTAFYSNAANFNSTDSAVEIFKNSERAAIKRISMEIKRSIVSYRRKSKASPAKIYLTGRGSLLPDFSSILSEDQGVSVEYFNPLEKLAISSKVDSNYLAANAASLSELVGEAARLMLKDAVGLNLLPEHITQEHAFEAKRPLLIFSAAVLAASMVLPFLYLNENINVLKENERALSSQIPSMNERYNNVEQNRAQLDSLVTKIKGLEGLANTKANWMNFFVDLETRLVDAKDVWLDDLKVIRTAPTINNAGVVTKEAEYKLEISGRFLLRDSATNGEASYDNEKALARIEALISSFKESSFINDHVNVRTDPSNPRILKFNFTLLVNPNKPI